MSAQRLSQRSGYHVRLMQEKRNSIASVTHFFARTLSTNDSQKAGKASTDPFNLILSKVKTFNFGLQKLKSDFFVSIYIKEAEQTRSFLHKKSTLQYEQRRKKMRLHEKHGIHIMVQHGGEKREVAFIPSNVHSHVAKNTNLKHVQYPEQKFYASSNYLSTRRPQEQLRQISRDLQVTLPTVAAFVLIPFVGYSFLFLGMMFPRLLLSRQFHTKEQRWYFATKEYGERRSYFDRLNTDFWGSNMMRMPSLKMGNNDESVIQRESNSKSLESLSYQFVDAGGPVLSESSMNVLYHLLKQGHTTSSIASLPNTHIHSLALVNNFAAPLLLPQSLSPLFLQTCLPSIYLKNKLVTLAEDIIMDDAALIEEGQIDIHCNGMTEEEVLDACWMRGLPVGRYARCNDGVKDELQMMRSMLTNYLQMMQYAHNSVGSDVDLSSRSALVRDDALQLLILHFPAIRYQLMNRQE